MTLLEPLVYSLIRMSPRKPRELVAALPDEDEREVRVAIKSLIEQGRIRPGIKWNLVAVS